jgi:hypothetical protein
VPWLLGAVVENVGAATGASILLVAPLSMAMWLWQIESRTNPGLTGRTRPVYR